jgi:chemotaxis protein CheX
MSSANPALVSGESRGCWIPLLQVAVQEVFETMLGSHLETPPESFTEGKLDITAMVGLAGQLCGVMTVRCSAKSAARMASKMLGIDADKAGPEIWDAIGEVCNMTAGNFKNKIRGLGDGCMLSVPTVITGGDYNLHSLTDTGALRITMLFEGEPIVVSLELHS